MKYFLFHCWGGDGRSCWSGWLADQLSVLGCEASGDTRNRSSISVRSVAGQHCRLAGEACMVPGSVSGVSSPGSRVLSPDFPETQNPKLETWLAKAREMVPKFNPADSWVLVGHSLGCPMILRLLESFKEEERVKAVVLVAGFAKDLGIGEIRNFVDHDFDWKKIKKKAEKFVVINSDNDPFIDLSEGKRIAKLLGAQFIIEHNAGHINEGSGFTEYPRLLEIIQSL